MSRTRDYSSPLRAEQQEQTRVRILEAVLEELTEREPEDLSMPAIAERANVALRTVYRHFPTKEGLMDAFWEWWIGAFGVRDDVPVNPDEFPRYVQDLYAAFDKWEPITRALGRSRAGREVRSRTRHRRFEMLKKTMSSVTEKLSPTDRRRALAIFKLFDSLPGWETLRDHEGMTPEDAREAAAWAIRVLIDELRRSPRALKGTKGEKK
jgi:AcrR family transcriptional regulator